MAAITLTDKEIRSALKIYLAKTSPVALLDEVRVHNGNAIADVVAIHTSAHCYEIKGETDEVRRITKQATFYDLSFIETTLVTTNNHLAAARRLAPAHWGILVAWLDGDSVEFRPERPATVSSVFDKQLALLTLWKSELLTLCRNEPVKEHRMSKAALSALIAGEREIKDITYQIGDLLAKRQTNREWSLTI